MLVAIIIIQILILLGVIGALVNISLLSKDVARLQKFVDQVVKTLAQEILATHNSVSSVHKRIDAIFSVDPPTENQISKNNIQGEELSEDNFINQVPQDLKFEIEGGDSQIPPAYWKNHGGGTK